MVIETLHGMQVANDSNVKEGYIREIDGLRAVAVLAVVIFHLNPNLLPGGFSGVDVFFVISGYVVSGSLDKQPGNFRQFSVGFYARRLLRIYPALICCLMVSALLQTLFIPSSWLSSTSIKSGIAAFFGLSNFALIFYSDGYFSPRVEFNLFTHTWSLAVEEQFYLLYPAIFYCFARRRSVNWLLPTLLLLSLAVSGHQTRSAADQAYYLLPSRFWELACGAALFVFKRRGWFSLQPNRSLNAIGCLGLLLIAGGLIFSDPSSFPFPWAIMPVAGTMLVIYGVTVGAQEDAFVRRILGRELAIYIGRISYSLYLWHWPIICLFRWTVGIDRPIEMLSAGLCTMVASVASYHLIERKVREIPLIESKSDRQIVAGGLTVVTMAAAAAACVFVAQPYLSLSVTKDKQTWYPDAAAQRAMSSDATVAPTTLRRRTVYVIGDSHAWAYSTMLQMLANERNMSVRLLGKAGCSIAGLLVESSPDCASFIDEAIGKVKAEAQVGDIVFLASLRMNRLSDQWATFNDREVAATRARSNSRHVREAVLREATSIIGRFEAMGLQVVIDAPKPVFKSPPFRCSDWFNSNNPVCKAGLQMSRVQLIEQRRPVMESLTLLSAAHPKLLVWDPFPVLCPAATCMASRDHLPLFFDGDHLSGHANRLLYPSFLSVIESVVPP